MVNHPNQLTAHFHRGSLSIRKHAVHLCKALGKGHMTQVFVSDNKLVIEMQGWDKLWALKSRLEIPIEHIKAVRADPEIAKRGRRGIRMLGTYVPGVITAGSFRQDGDRIFWNVHRPENVIVIELHDEPYAKLIIEVLEPAVTVATIHNTLSARAA